MSDQVNQLALQPTQRVLNPQANQPSTFPLQGIVAQYDFKLSDPESKLSDFWSGSKDGPKQTPSSTQLFAPSASVDPTKRKRIWTLGEEEESGTESCDYFMTSDTDTSSMVSNNGSILALLRENRLVHPPKRRLTMSEVSEATVNNTSGSNLNAGVSTGAPALGSAPAAGALVSGSTIAGAGISSSIGEVTVPRTPTAFNSPSNTPISEIEEDSDITGEVVTEEEENLNQQLLLPLPSPSASPVLSYTKDVTPIATSNSNAYPTNFKLLPNSAPVTQVELVNMMMGLSGHLNENNKNHLIFKLLQNVRRSTLSSFNDIIRQSLKRDLMSNLPLEITYNILKKLDYKTVCSLARVCSNWNRIINSSGIWSELLKRDKLVSGDEEIERELENEKEELKKWSTMPNSPNLNYVQLLFKKRRIILNRWMDPKYEPKRISVPGHGTNGSNVVTCLQHDDEKIITGVDDKLININSSKTGKLLKVLKGHEGGVWALKYTGNTLVSGSTDRTVRVWNIKTGKCTQVFRGHTSTVRCLDILHPVKIGTDDNGEDIMFPQTPLLVTGSRDHNLHVWRLPLVDENDTEEDDNKSDPIEVETSGSNDLDNPYLVAVLSGHTHSVRSVSGYGNIIVSGSYDTTVRVWDLLDGGKCKHILGGHQNKIYSTALDFYNKRCYSGSMDATINVWDFEKGRLLYTLEGHLSLVGLLELSKEYLVSAAADATLRVWDPETGRNLSKLEGHTAAITCFQHDNLRIVSGSEKMLKLWDIKTGKFVRDLLADITGCIWQVRFDYCRCVAAVDRSANDNRETFIEIVDFSTPPT